MNKIFIAGLMLAMVVGCNHNKKNSTNCCTQKSTTQMSAKDDCPMCPGVQTANADGTCPKCGMKVKG